MPQPPVQDAPVCRSDLCHLVHLEFTRSCQAFVFERYVDPSTPSTSATAATVVVKSALKIECKKQQDIKNRRYI